MNTEFEKAVRHSLSSTQGQTMHRAESFEEQHQAKEQVVTYILKAHNQHLRTVLEGLHAAYDKYYEEGYRGEATYIKAIDAEINKLETNHE